MQRHENPSENGRSPLREKGISDIPLWVLIRPYSMARKINFDKPKPAYYLPFRSLRAILFMTVETSRIRARVGVSVRRLARSGRGALAEPVAHKREQFGSPITATRRSLTSLKNTYRIIETLGV